MKVENILPKIKEKTPKDILREQHKGKKTFTQEEINQLTLQMAKDEGYIGG
jgi:hypothetical protein